MEPERLLTATLVVLGIGSLIAGGLLLATRRFDWVPGRAFWFTTIALMLIALLVAQALGTPPVAIGIAAVGVGVVAAIAYFGGKERIR
jgi:hypothetical protein